MTVPDDAGTVLTAIRLGWSIAEVRGRNRPDAPPGAGARLPGVPGHALPLRVEQTPAELRIAAQSVLGAMAGELGVDSGGANQASYSQAIDAQARVLAKAREGATAALAAAVPAGAAVPDAAVPDLAAVPGGAAVPDLAAVPGVAAVPDLAAVPDVAVPDLAAVPGLTAVPDVAVPDAVAAHVPAVAHAQAAGDPAAQWAALQELIFKFDAHIQDALALGPDTVACGYQLGRALAEPYWALDPALDTGDNPAAWQFLLGSIRCREMGRLAGRLGAYLHPYTPAAIAGSVQIWKHVAADKAWRSNAEECLYRQMRTWYELVAMQQDPTTLVKPYALTRNHRMIVRALRIFWPEVLGITVAAAALSGFVVLLGENKVNSLLNSALGLIAIAGFTTAGLLARLKNQAQAMVTRLRQDVYTDLVAVAITAAPPMPSVPNTGLPLVQSKRSRQNAQLVRMARERGITPVTPN
jgi:hypothetical protein